MSPDEVEAIRRAERLAKGFIIESPENDPPPDEPNEEKQDPQP